jgi:hypothetical protein
MNARRYHRSGGAAFAPGTPTDSHLRSLAPIASAIEAPALQYPGNTRSRGKITRSDGYFAPVSRNIAPALKRWLTISDRQRRRKWLRHRSC